MDRCYGQHGWKEFHRNRKDILAEFDKIFEQTLNRPIKVAHGQGVEAYIRKWLAEFLPKKYAVTSGYIIPDLYDDTFNLYHYDIIIYDYMESPILWTEGNQDDSEQGKFRAIPAKHVYAVYEVKSRLTKSNVTEALKKLDQTKHFTDQLHKNYSCGLIFIDLKESDNNQESIIEQLHKGINIFGFSGGVVLRYEKDHSVTGLMSVLRGEPNDEPKRQHRKPLAKPIDSLDIYMTEDNSLEIAEKGGGAKLSFNARQNKWLVSKFYSVIYDDGNLITSLSWSKTNFSEFCINLLSSLEGLEFNNRHRPVFGQIFDKIEKKSALPQSEVPKRNLPFVVVERAKSNSGDKFFVDPNESKLIFKFWVEVKNESDIEVTVSHDSFKKRYNLSAQDSIVIPVNFTGNLNKPFQIETPGPEHKNNYLKSFIQGLLVIRYRLVYYPTQGKKEFYSVEKDIQIYGSELEVI